MSRYAIKRKELFAISLAPFLGFLAFLLPQVRKLVIKTNIDHFELIPFIVKVFADAVPLSLVLLFAAGAIVGFLGARFWVGGGILTMLVFPLVSIFDIVTRPGFHNLWFIEFPLYTVLTLPGLIGSYIGSRYAPLPSAEKRGIARE